MVVVTTPMRVGTHWVFNSLRSISGLPSDYWHKDLFVNGERKPTEEHIVRSHYAMPSTILKSYPNTKVVVVLRDIRDVIVSLFFYLKHDPMGWNVKTEREKLPIGTTMKEFIYSDRVKEEVRAHIQYWKEIDSNKDNVIVVTYEEIVRDTYGTIGKIARLVGYPYDFETVKMCTDGNGFRAMSTRKEGDEKQDAFYRKGIVGDYKNHMDLTDLEYLNHIVREEGGDRRVFYDMDTK